MTKIQGFLAELQDVFTEEEMGAKYRKKIQNIHGFHFSIPLLLMLVNTEKN